MRKSSALFLILLLLFSTAVVHAGDKLSGSWDYGYPLDKTGSLTTDVPWIGITYDSEDIADSISDQW